MFLSGYADVFGLPPAPPAHQAILPGDHVVTGANAFPQFEVVAVVGEKAWIRDLQSGQDHFAPVSRCRKLASPDPALPLQ